MLFPTSDRDLPVTACRHHSYNSENKIKIMMRSSRLKPLLQKTEAQQILRFAQDDNGANGKCDEIVRPTYAGNPSQSP